MSALPASATPAARSESVPVLDVFVRRKRFGGRDVLRDVSLRVGEGEVVAVVGASGCGKSTLLRIVAGLDREHDGRVRLDGRDVTAPTRDIRFVFQEPRLFPWLDVERNVAFDAPGGRVDRTRVDGLLKETGLDGLAGRLPKQLSGGQAQRVAIARGLYLQPRLLLLDEPFSAVDAFTRLRLQELLLQVVQAHRVAVLLVTHDIDEAVRLGDRVVVLHSAPGRIAADISVPLPHPRDADAELHASVASAVRQGLRAAHAL